MCNVLYISGLHTTSYEQINENFKNYFQTLSRTVAAAMMTLADLGVLADEAKHTAEFICDINDLFDFFNSSNMYDANPKKNAFHLGDSEQLRYLEETLKWLEKVRCPTGKRLPCLEGWKSNIRAMLSLSEDFRNSDLKFLLTRRFNQDSNEHLFGQIRGKGGYQDHPDARLFRQEYRQTVVDHLATVGENGNCELDDESHILLRISQLYQVLMFKQLLKFLLTSCSN